nr:unnamed protein product [Callosobruchus analis]
MALKIIYDRAIVPIASYGSIIWGHRAELVVPALKINTAQAVCLRAVMGLYNSVPSESVSVLAKRPPLNLEILKLKSIGLIKKEGRTTLFGQEIVPQEYRYACVLKRHMEDLVMREWQLTWSASGKGRYCRELIPNVRMWCEQGDFPITRRCAIFLSSHAELGVHLHRVGKSDSPMCEACGVVDSPSHRITSCVNFRQVQTGLLAKAGLDGNNFTADELVLALGRWEYIIVDTQPAPLIMSEVSWSDEMTLLLIELYRQLRNKVGCLQIKNMKKLWKIIAEKNKCYFWM